MKLKEKIKVLTSKGMIKASDASGVFIYGSERIEADFIDSKPVTYMLLLFRKIDGKLSETEFDELVASFNKLAKKNKEKAENKNNHNNQHKKRKR